MPRWRPAVHRLARLAACIPLLASLLGFGSAPARGAEPADPDFADPTASAESASFLSSHRKSLLWISAGGAAASAVTAILFRRAANDRYDEYQQTADPEAITDLYTEAKHLDQVATGFFIGAEALFVATIYLGFFVEPAQSAAVSLPHPASFTPVLNQSPAGATRLGLAWHF
ncbi:MAG TPA: hypothetical protein VNM87_08380 [Candidatus Udaeobacter sp.]|nr:hypothetical protein [Candidatus Udaeobacter sp.]